MIIEKQKCAINTILKINEIFLKYQLNKAFS